MTKIILILAILSVIAGTLIIQEVNADLTLIGMPTDQLDVIQVPGGPATGFGTGSISSTAVCPNSHKLIGGGVDDLVLDSIDAFERYQIENSADFQANSWTVDVTFNFYNVVILRSYAMCAQLNIMNVVGGMFIQPDSTALFLAYGIANAVWIVPSVAGIGIAVYLTKTRWNR